MYGSFAFCTFGEALGPPVEGIETEGFLRMILPAADVVVVDVDVI